MACVRALAGIVTLLTACMEAEAQYPGRLLLWNPTTGANAGAVIDETGKYLAGPEGTERLQVLGLPPVAHIGGIAFYSPFYKVQSIWIGSRGEVNYYPPADGCGRGDFEIALPVAANASNIYLICLNLVGRTVEIGGVGVTVDATGRGSPVSYVPYFKAPYPAGLPRFTYAVTTPNDALFYDPGSGAMAAGRVTPDPFDWDNHRFELAPAGTTAQGYSRMVAVGDRIFFFAPAAGGVFDAGGVFESGRLVTRTTGRPGDPDRSFAASYQRVTPPNVLPANFGFLGQVAAVGDYVMLYGTANGAYVVARLDEAGGLSFASIGTTSSGYQHLVAANGHLFFLSEAEGNAAIGRITPAGAYEQLQTLNVGPYTNVASTDAVRHNW